MVYSAEVIVSDHYGFGDHIEAIVYLGVDRSLPNLFPMHEVLRLYLDATGQMVKDRYSPAQRQQQR